MAASAARAYSFGTTNHCCAFRLTDPIPQIRSLLMNKKSFAVVCLLLSLGVLSGAKTTLTNLDNATGWKSCTQCGFASGVWRVYDAYNHRWVATTIPCSSTAAYKWHHLVLEFHRTSTGKSQFLTLSINGQKFYLNRTYSPKATSIKSVNVAFQMDGNKYQTDYSTWLDKVNLKYW